MNQDFINHIIQSAQIGLLGKKTDSYDVIHMAALSSSIDSANYYANHMYKSRNFNSDLELLTHAVNSISIPGAICEFGVASGRTINHIASLCKQKVFGFDVFTGLPEVWRTGFEAGMFAQELPVVRENVELIIGLFEDVLPVFSLENSENLALLHIDCDLYSATKTIFWNLDNKIKPGTVIIFDEYFNYPGWRHHEYRAFQEWVHRSKVRYHYDSFVSAHQQVCIIIDAVG